MIRMAPLSRPVTLNESKEAMHCESTAGSNAKAAVGRRVIFPSLYSERSEEVNVAQEEEAVQLSTDDGPSPLTRENMEALSSSFQFRSPAPAHGPLQAARRCEELCLDMPEMFLDKRTKASIHSSTTAKNAKKVTKDTKSPPCASRRSDEDEQLLEALATSLPLRSPGLPPKIPCRMCDELGLDMPALSLDDNTTNHRSIAVAPKAKAVNRQHFSRQKQPTNGEKPSPQRRSRIDSSSKDYVTPKPTASERPRALTKQPSSPPTRASILRPSKWSAGTTDASSLDKQSSIPSLVPLGDGSNSSSETLHSQLSTTTASEDSEAPSPRKKPRSVSFDPRVWVLEYERSRDELDTTWFTSEELEHFRKQTIARLVAHNTELLPSGTGFLVQRGSISSKALFALPAMSCAGEDDDNYEVSEREVVTTINAEIQHILVVDPHDVVCKLFTRDLKNMLPQVNVCTASSSQKARERMKDIKRLDIVIVEERLKLFHRRATDLWAASLSEGHVSGSEFIKILQKESEERPPEDRSLFIAVSAHLDKDKQRMQANGADFIWAKPPPTLDEIVRDVLLKALLIKREKQELADRLFGDVMGAP